MKKLGLGVMVLFMLTSCYKEEMNAKPKVSSISKDHEFVKIGETLALDALVSDEDGDNIVYKWKTTDGQVVGADSTSHAEWKVPTTPGTYHIDLEVNDGKVNSSQRYEVNVKGYAYDEFDSLKVDWQFSNGSGAHKVNRMEISTDVTQGEGVVLGDLVRSIEPPYSVYMDLGVCEASSAFTSTDKYGLLLDFYNAAADTVVKGLWFRIYPENTNQNWKASVYQDTGNSNAWVNLDDTASGVNASILSNKEETNHLRIDVLNDHQIQIYCNDDLVYTSATLAKSFLSGGVPPKLKLDKIGMRSSTGKVYVDNVFVSRDIAIDYNQIFN